MIPTRDILPRLVRKYVELSEVCYRVTVAARDERGRFRRRHPGRRPHPALLKKIDVDHALAAVYRRFFESRDAAISTPTSKSRCQGSDARTAPTGSSAANPSRSEATRCASGASS
jgi:hypothetical protein